MLVWVCLEIVEIGSISQNAFLTAKFTRGLSHLSLARCFLQSYFLNRYSNGCVEQNQFQKELPERNKEEEPTADNMSRLQTWQNAAHYGSLSGAEEEWATFISGLWPRSGHFLGEMWQL